MTMLTKIIIRHETVEALKQSELWKQIMDIFLKAEEPVEVIEIAMEEDEE
jgi:hypothetical protein